MTFACLALLACSGLAFAQSQRAAATVPLKGGRFKPLTATEFTPEQKTMADHVMANVGTLSGPSNILLRSPVMGDYSQLMYNELRLRSAIPQKLSEFAVMLVAREWTVQFMWYAHSRAAARAGLDKEVIDAVAVGKRPASMKPDEEAIYTFCHELLTDKRVSDAAYKAVVDQFGEKGAVDLMGTPGNFHMVAMMLNVDGYPLPEGVPTQLMPLQANR